MRKHAQFPLARIGQAGARIGRRFLCRCTTLNRLRLAARDRRFRRFRPRGNRHRRRLAGAAEQRCTLGARPAQPAERRADRRDRGGLAGEILAKLREQTARILGREDVHHEPDEGNLPLRRGGEETLAAFKHEARGLQPEIDLGEAAVALAPLARDPDLAAADGERGEHRRDRDDHADARADAAALAPGLRGLGLQPGDLGLGLTAGEILGAVRVRHAPIVA
jgi:hypothetical protein